MITEKGYPEVSDISICQGLAASQEPRPSERTLSTDLFNPFGNKSVLLDRLDGRYHSSLPENQCSIPNGLRLSCEGRSPM